MKNYQKQVEDYLDKVSNHTFKGMDGHYKDRYKKVIKVDGEYKILSWSAHMKDYVLEDIYHKRTVKFYGENAKCVISHRIFLQPFGRKWVSVRQNKYVVEEVNGILEKIGK